MVRYLSENYWIAQIDKNVNDDAAEDDCNDRNDRNDDDENDDVDENDVIFGGGCGSEPFHSKAVFFSFYTNLHKTTKSVKFKYFEVC